MPVAAPAIKGSLLLAGLAMTGPKWREMAGIVARSVASWVKLQSNVSLIGTVAGSAGSGRVTGKLWVPPNPALVAQVFRAHGISGPTSKLLATAVGVGIPSVLSAMGAYTGNAVGVGVGTDVSKVTFANSLTLSATLRQNMVSAGWSGPQVGVVSSALGRAIAGLLMAGTGTGVVAGAAGPMPAAGTSMSRVM